MTATLVAACWFIANVLVVWFLRPRHGYTERAIISFPAHGSSSACR